MAILYQKKGNTFIKIREVEQKDKNIVQNKLLETSFCALLAGKKMKETPIFSWDEKGITSFGIRFRGMSGYIPNLKG